MFEEPEKFFSAKVDAYAQYISLFLYPQGFRAFFAGVDWLTSGLRVLDAGCGTGVVTIAFLEALKRHGYKVECSHAFDLTPAMLDRFRKELEQRELKKIDLCQANVLDLKQLPESWTGYDVIVTASMLEYIPRHKLPEALVSLRSRLSPGGRLLLFITRRSWMTKWLVERPWGGNRYSRQELVEAFAASGFEDITFETFPFNYYWLNLWGLIVQGRI